MFQIEKPLEPLTVNVTSHIPMLDSGKHNEPATENSLNQIREVTLPYADELQEVPLSTTPCIEDGDLEEIEEVDSLSPLIMDNHTVVDHHELFKESVLNIKEFQPALYRPPPIKNCDIKEYSGDSVPSSEYRRSSNDYSSDAISSDENVKELARDLGHVDKAEKEEEDLGPIEIPDDEMAEKIVQQVEFYFSNENILKDAFLLKHVRRNKEGFVSLKLISSFKRVRQLTKDWRVVGYAIKLKSHNIQLNELGTKIRRLEQLPTFDETMPSRTVVGYDLPVDKLTIEKVSDLFSKCGEIALIRILRPGGTIPPDVRQFLNKYPDMQQKELAFVEFIESQSARNAQNIEGISVLEMVAPKKKTGKKASVGKLIENYLYANHPDGERSRSGSGGEYTLRRNSSNFYVKTDQHLCHHEPQRKCSFGNENHDHYIRRSSHGSLNGGDTSRKYSNCSEGYSSCSDMSRRTSTCSDMSRRTSNCSDAPFRRISNCTDYCPCSRRSSQCSDAPFRRMSQCSEHNRRFSNASIHYDRRISNASDGSSRRLSFDSDYERDRKISTGSANFDHYRKISATYDPMIRKYSNGEQYMRKISTDSGYDRKISTGSMSDYGSSPRSRSNSFITNVNKTENLVRTPIGPDGSKGFSPRARKVGQIVNPV